MTTAKTMVLALALAGTAAFAQENAAPKAAPAQPAPAATTTANAAVTDPVIIAAGNVAIKKSDFEAAIKTLPAEYQQYAMGPGKKQFAEDFLRMKLLAAEGLKNGLDKSAEVQRQLDLMKENLVATEELHKIEGDIVISDADLQKAYDANKKEYEQVKARHILIAYKGSPAAQKDKKPLTEAEAKAKADEIRAQLVKDPSKFAEVAKKESDDVESGKNGGELGSFSRGQMVPEFEEAAFAAKPGEITPVVKTQFGYHIIQVQEHSLRPLADEKATLEKTLRQQKLREALDAMKDAAKPTFNEAYFAAPKAPEQPAVKKQ